MEQSKSLPVIYSNQNRLARYAIWLLAGCIGLLVVVSFILGVLALVASEGALNPFTHLFFLPFTTTIYGLIGLLITRKHPENTVGWLLLLVGLGSAVTLLSVTYINFARFSLQSESGALFDIFRWLDKWIWAIPSVVPLTFVLQLFPDGKTLSPRWRVLVWLTGISLAGMMLATAFYPAALPEFGLSEDNPFGIRGAEIVLGGVLNISSLLLMVSLFGSVAAVIMRYRRADGIQRIQLKWLMYAAGLMLLVLAGVTAFGLANPDNPDLIELSIIATSGGVSLIIVVIGIAILRHQLWDVDTVINRTLVYGILTLIVIGMYVLIVSFLSTLFDGDNLLFSLVATVLVAVSFQSLRDIVQRRISKFLFGQRDDPFAALQQISEQLDPIMAVHEVLPAVVNAIGQTLRLPYVAVMLWHNDRYQPEAVYSTSGAKPAQLSLETMPLTYQSESVGQLILAPRSESEAFTISERDLLGAIARQVAIAAYNVRLTTELQRSREQIVTAREEERRRLRRDLHDGLGPVLAAMSFRLDAVHNFVEQDPDQARKLIGELKTQVQSSLAEIRRIAYNLRPPALDELGLLGALREHIDATQRHDGLHYILEVPEVLPPLSAAVEVATYRIVMESVTNVQRHANATICTVRIAFDDPDNKLMLDIIDDGRGIAEQQPAGVGLTAIRERTSELGGQFAMPRDNGGTHIQVWLPLYNDGKS